MRPLAVASETRALARPRSSSASGRSRRAISRILLSRRPRGRAGEALQLVLDGEPDLRVVAEDGERRALEAVERLLHGRRPADMAVLDVAMPRLTGLQAAAELARVALAVRILMLSMHDNEQGICSRR